MAITVEGGNARDDSAEATELLSALRKSDPALEPKLTRTDGEALDGGATLVLVLGAPAVVALAHGIAAYFRKRGGRKSALKVEIKTKHRKRTSELTLTAEGDAADPEKLAELISRSIQSES